MKTDSSSNTVIRVEGLGKKYQIGYKQGPYATLRDTITTGVKSLQNKVLFPFSRHRSSSNSGEFWALQDVSFNIQQGEVVGIIGRNGAGKSTLLKILSRITEPSTGRVMLRGHVSSLLEVGTGFHHELTGRENIYLNGAILGMGRAEIKKKFDEIVAFAEVEKFLDTPVKHYSSGMYVRLAFAVAAHLEPDILVVDEVLAVGDYEFQKKSLGRMEAISREGRTVLLVSHNMASVANLCQRAILLSAGKVIQVGPTAEVVQHYLTTTRSVDGEIVWSTPEEAPGSGTVRLHAVRILQAGVTGPIVNVDISKEVIIQIAYWNLREGNALHAAIWLKDQMGNPVLASSNHKNVSLTHDRWYRQPCPVGLFQSECRIPGKLLNEGLYSITVIIGSSRADDIFEDHILSFQVHDTGEMRQEHPGAFVGVVRPQLAWQTEYITSAEMGTIKPTETDQR